MASERQLAANRCNASKSTGPRSHAGKRRAAKNAFKHGLAVSFTAARNQDPLLEERATEIAGKIDHPAVRECARKIAAAELELDRIDRVRIGLIEGAGRDYGRQEEDVVGEGPNAGGASSADPQQSSPGEIDRTAEASRRVLSELLSTVNYERRAANKRDKAIRRLSKLKRELAVKD